MCKALDILGMHKPNVTYNSRYVCTSQFWRESRGIARISEVVKRPECARTRVNSLSARRMHLDEARTLYFTQSFGMPMLLLSTLRPARVLTLQILSAHKVILALRVQLMRIR